MKHFLQTNKSFSFSLLLMLLCGFSNYYANAQAPTLGSYSNITMVAGQNTTVSPSSVPANTVSMVAYASTNFTGVLSSTPSSGVVTITNAKQVGVYTVTVKAFGAGSATTSFTLTVTKPYASSGLFSTPSDVNIADNDTRYIAVGDFNNDSKQDLAVAHQNSTLSIRLGDGLGGFSGTSNINAGGSAWSVAVGDFNEDGNQDIAVPNTVSSVSIRLGDGNGGFTGSTSISVGSHPYMVAIADFNNDGHQDIATPNNSSNNVSIRFGDGSGGFSGSGQINVGLDPRILVIGDFNSDGNQDFACCNYYSSTVSIKLGNGLGSFSGLTNISLAGQPWSVDMGDFNNDGIQDLASAFNSGVAIHLGDGLGGFNYSSTITGKGYGTAVGDFNGDGNQDLAITDDNSLLKIRFGYGNGMFYGTTNLTIANSPRYLAMGDFNADGSNDLAIPRYAGSQYISVLLGLTNAEINVKGNSVSIVDGDNSPSLIDSTQFGNAIVSGSESRIFTIQNLGGEDLSISSITSSNALFTVIGSPTSITAGDSATFAVTFSPTASGTQTSTITINNDDTDEGVYNFAVSGNGVCAISGNIWYVNSSAAPGGNGASWSCAFQTINEAITAASSGHEVWVAAGTYKPNQDPFGNFSPSDPRDKTFYVKDGVKLYGGFAGFESTLSARDLTTNITTLSGDFNSNDAISGSGNTLLIANNAENAYHVVLAATTNTGVGVTIDGFSITGGNANVFSTISVNGNPIDRASGGGIHTYYGTNTLSNNTLSGNSAVYGGGIYATLGTNALLNNTLSGNSAIIGGGIYTFGGPNTLLNNTLSGNKASTEGGGIYTVNGPNTLSNNTLSGNSAIIGGGIYMMTSNTTLRNNTFSGNRASNGGGICVGPNNTSTVANCIFWGNQKAGSSTVAGADIESDLSRPSSLMNTFVIYCLTQQNSLYSAGTGIINNQDPLFVNASDIDGADNLYRTADDGLSLQLCSPAINAGNTSITTPLNDITGFVRGAVPFDLGAYEFQGSLNQPEMNVQGGVPLVNILDGDNVPTTTDSTDFGNVNVGSNKIHSFTINNTGSSTLNITSITSDNSTYTISAEPTFITAGNSATFNVNFSPTTNGVQNATITINNNDCDEGVYDFAVTGNGALSGAALNFDGLTASVVGDYVNVPDGANLDVTSAVTVEAWINASVWKTNVSDGSIVCKHGRVPLNTGVRTGYVLRCGANGTLNFTIGTNSNSFPGATSPAEMALNTWTHVAGVFDGSTIKVYINGMLKGSAPYTGTIVPNNYNLRIGNSDHYFGRAFQGSIDEVRVWNRALCQAEIQNNMNCELAGSQTGLVSYYKFNHGLAGQNNTGVTTLTDASGNANHGTLTNFALNGTTSNWVTPGGVTSGTSCLAYLAPEINVQGGSPLVSIMDGDIIPTTTDSTNFGNVVVGNNKVHSFTIQNTGNAALSVTSITSNNPTYTISGAPASVAVGSSATFNVTFSPTAAGTQNATITINNDDCDEGVYDFAVTGNGVTPPTLGTYSNTTVIAGQNTTVIPSTPPTNTTSTVAYTNSNFTGVLSVNPTTGVVTVTDAMQAGTYTITVKAFGVGSTTTTFTLTVSNPNCSLGQFKDTIDVSVNVQPYSIAVGDFNGDGKQDLATANLGSNNISIRLGDGNGGFITGTNVNVGAQPYSIAVGDFNGDGIQDLTTANYGSNNVSICLGNGSGGFGTSTNFTVGLHPIFVAVGDFNSDGKQDIASSNNGSNNVSILLGDGMGVFSSITPLSVGNAPYSIALGDFNNDGKEDIASANSSNDNVSIDIGDGNGGFTGSTIISTGDSTFYVVVADFNADGKQDLVTSTYLGNDVRILLGDGIGGFSLSTTIIVGVNPTAIAIGDFNGDGKQDFAVANTGSSTISIRLNDGIGGFYNGFNLITNYVSNPVSLCIGDFNYDGKEDIAFANQNTNTIAIRLGAEGKINIKGNNISIVKGDITPSATDHTDFENVLVGVNFVRTYTIKNTGTATLYIANITSSNSLFAISGVSTSVAVGDSATFSVTFSPIASGVQSATITINNYDCNQAVYDFAVTGSGVPAPTLGTYANTTVISGQNTTITPSAVPSNTTSIVAFTNTNFTGVFSVNPTTGVVTVTDAKQAGTYTVTVKAFNNYSSATTTCTLTVTNPNCSQAMFASATDFSVGTNPSAVVIGDFNSDGIQDFGAVNYNNDNVKIYFGDGLGGFNYISTIGVGNTPRAMVIGDFNGDGKQDFATSNLNSDDVSVRLGDGLGGFSGTSISVGDNPYSMALGDFNGDGKLDIATVNSFSNDVSIRLGDGLGGFNGTTDISVGINPSCLAIGDFNGDGKQDFATGNVNFSNVSIRLGDGLGGFITATDVSVGTAPWSIAIGDFNGDNNQDFATTNRYSDDVSIRLGDGLGGFSGTTTIGVGDNPIHIQIGDFNSDGKQDFVAANLYSNVSIRLGDGLGSFYGTTDLAIASNPDAVAIGDFNGDGIQDIATSNNATNTVSILLGLASQTEINVQGGVPLVNVVDGDLVPTTIDSTYFGNVNFGVNKIHSFTIHNTGSATLNISSITSNNSTYTISAAPSSISSGNSATFNVTFSPIASGLQNATITINNNDCNEGVYNFAVTGNGCVSPTITCPINQLINNATALCSNTVTYTSSPIVSGTPTPIVTYLFSGATTGSGIGDGDGSSFNVGITTVKLYATNTCGIDSCSFTITITDTTKPTIVCSGPVTVNNTTGLCTGTTILTAPTVSDNCPYLGNALDFDGVDDRINVNTNSDSQTGTFTVECWAKAGHANNTLSILSSRYPVDEGFDIKFYTGNKIHADIGDGSNWLTTTADADLNYVVGQWYHIAYVVTPTGYTIYINGLASDSGSYSGIPVLFDVNHTLIIGSYRESPINFYENYQGQIDELRIWNTARTQTQIQTNMNQELGTQCGLVASYHFNHGIANATNTGVTSLADASANSYNGTLANFDLSGSSSNWVMGQALNYTISNNAPCAFSVGNTTVTWTATDVSGNTNTCTQVVTVNDTTKPTVSCPGNITQANDAGICGAAITYTVTSFDNCTGQTVAQSQGLASGSIFPVGTTTNKFVVTDASGNKDSCTFTVTITDTTKPILICSNMYLNTITGSCYAVPSAFPIAIDNCAGSINVYQTAGAQFGQYLPIGSYPVEFQAIDSSGNIASCTFTVTISDTTKPTITCPGNITQNNDANLCSAVVTYTVTSSDNCTGQTVAQATGLASGSIFPIGTTSNKFIVTDASGNKDSCTFTVTITDTTKPSIICSGPVTINNTPGLCSGTTNLIVPTVTDNCSVIGNALQFDGVNDRVPVGTGINLTGPFTIEAWVMPTFKSNFSTILGNKIGSFTNPGFVFAINNFQQSDGKLIFESQNTQISSVSSVINWGVWQHISITYDGSIVKMYLNGTSILLDNPSAINLISPGNPAVIGDFFHFVSAGKFKGTMDELRVWNVARSQSQLSANLNFELNAQPGLVAAYHFNQGIAGGNNTSSPGPAINTAIDASGNVNTGTLSGFALNGPTSNWISGAVFGLTFSNNAPTTYPVGNTTVTWTATDSSGNSNTCAQIVTVIDNQKPTITCPGNISQDNDAGLCSAVVTYSVPVGIDNCPSATTLQTEGLASGSAFPVGVTTNKFVVTDASGNKDSCSFTVTITDTTKPTIVCANDTTVNANSNGCLFVGSINAPIASDNCSGVQLSGPSPAGPYGLGTTTLTWTATDASNNTQTCTQLLTVNPVVVYNTSSAVNCDSFTWTGTTYTMSGNYTKTFVSALGCDSIHTLNLTINNSKITQTYVTACDTFANLGATYSLSGVYTRSFTTSAGCDSTDYLHLTIVHTSSGQTSITACQSYTYFGNTYTASGIYATGAYNNAVNCDSTHVLLLTIKPASAASSSISICGSYLWTGTNYTMSGVYTKTFMNSLNCDSVHTLHLTITNGGMTASSQSACNSYTWTGTTYTMSGVYSKTFMNVQLCDSIHTLTLTINHSNNSTSTQTACNNYTWNGSTYTTSGTYYHYTTGSTGCADTATLVLIINYSNNTSTTQTACNNYSWNGTTYTSSGTYYHYTTGSTGCADTATLVLIINYSNNTITTQTACNNYTWYGTTYTNGGTYYHYTTGSTGCADTATLVLIINYSNNTSATQTACNNHTWYGTTYSTSGTYYHYTTGSTGCADTATLVLTIHVSTYGSINQSICSGASIVFNGQSINTSGTYYDTLQNVNNCDSFLTLNLTVTPGILLRAKALLGGPYNSNTLLMHDSLRVLGLIPHSEPYTSAPFNYLAIGDAGGDTIGNGVLSVTGSNAIVDWVMLEIRSAMSSSNILANKRALIQRDGDIVSSIDGQSPVSFNTLYADNYFVSVKHRNHLGLMTNTAMALTGCSGSNSIDFTTSSPVYQNVMITSNTPRKNINGLYAMWPGDANSNKNVKYNGSSNDKDYIALAIGGATSLNAYNLLVYRVEDVNMDGKIRYNGLDNDRVMILSNVGVNFPNTVLSQHTPN